MERLLAGGPGTLPLAALAVGDPGELPGVLARVRQRLPDPGSSNQARDLWVATYVLLGLSQSAEMADLLMPEVIPMEASSTYQAILERGRGRGLVEGRAEEARKLILVLGTDRFGAPDEAARAALEAVTDLGALEALARHVLRATGWADLLAPRLPTGNRSAGTGSE